MRVKRLMREKELNTNISHQVIPTVFEGTYLLYCDWKYCLLFKKGHGRFQKALFRNHIFNNSFQATLNTNMLPNACFYF